MMVKQLQKGLAKNNNKRFDYSIRFNLMISLDSLDLIDDYKWKSKGSKGEGQGALWAAIFGDSLPGQLQVQLTQFSSSTIGNRLQ